MKGILSVVAGLLALAGFVPYIRAILRGKTKPAKASWIIWAGLDTITIAGMYAKDALSGQIIGTVIGTWAVAVLMLKYGTPGWTRLDKLCLIGAVLGIALWLLFSSPTLGIIISLGVIFVGSIPTFTSAWKDPSREDKLTWAIFWISSVCASLAIPKWTLADAAAPVTFFTVQTIMLYILYVRPCSFTKAQRQKP